EGGVALAVPGSRCHGRIDEQSRTMLHQHVTQVTEPRLSSDALLIQARIGIRRRLMGVVMPCLAMEIHGRIAAVTRWVLLVTWPKALVTGPRFQQRAVDRKMLVRQQPLAIGMDQH